MIELKIGNNSMLINGIYKPMDVAPFIQNDRTFVPIRFVAEGLGYNVDWDDLTKEVTIYGRRKYFETVDEAAFDWAMHWNAMSIAIFKELGGIIYKDEKGYYWDEVKVGQDKAVYWNREKVKKGVAFIHSHSGGQHGSTNAMSFEDYNAAEKFNRPFYMVDSGGCLYVHDPNGTGKRQQLIKEGAPNDARWMDITKNSKLMNEYFAGGYHDLYEYEFGYKADYYNKLFMKGLHYLEERAV